MKLQAQQQQEQPTEYIFLKGLEITACRTVPLQKHYAANL